VEDPRFSFHVLFPRGDSFLQFLQWFQRFSDGVLEAVLVPAERLEHRWQDFGIWERILEVIEGAGDRVSVSAIR
jgi:transposase